MRAQGGLSSCETVSERAARLAAMEQVRRVMEHGTTERDQLQARAELAVLNAPPTTRQGTLLLVVAS